MGFLTILHLNHHKTNIYIFLGGVVRAPLIGWTLPSACGALRRRRGLLGAPQSCGALQTITGRFLQLQQVERGGAAGLEERGLRAFAFGRVLAVGLWRAATRRVDGGLDGHGVGNCCGGRGRSGGDGLWHVGIVELSRVGSLLRDRRSHLGEHVVGQNKGHHGGQHLRRREA